MSQILAITRRELKSYFLTPVAYVFIVIFLVFASAFTFYLGNFYERGQADLVSFFSKRNIPLAMRFACEPAKPPFCRLMSHMPSRLQSGSRCC